MWKSSCLLVYFVLLLGCCSLVMVVVFMRCWKLVCIWLSLVEILFVFMVVFGIVCVS